MADEEKRGKDRDAILARRRFFVASAMASVVATACDRGPMVCLEVAPVPTAGSPDGGPPPRPCLEIMPPEDAGTASAEDAGAPQPCLSVPMQTDASAEPRVCLKVALPKGDR